MTPTVRASSASHQEDLIRQWRPAVALRGLRGRQSEAELARLPQQAGPAQPSDDIAIVALRRR